MNALAWTGGSVSPLVSTIVMLVACLDVRAAGEDGFPLFVGRTVCEACHDDGAGGPCTLEDIPEHDRAYLMLSRPEAEEIALLCGVGARPSESRICLGCHATSADEGPRWRARTFDIEDGVQCEGCHGAGSRHVEVYRRAGHPRGPSKDPRPSGGEGPRRDSWPSGVHRVDRSSCEECHVARTSHEEVLELGFRRQPADRLYKTPVNLAVSPDGAELYVVCEHSDSLIVVDVSTRRVVKEVSVGRRPHDVAVSPDGRRLYVTNRLADSVSVIDVANREAVADVEVGHEPHGVLTDANGRHVYVLNTGSDSVSVLDAGTLKEVKRLFAGRGPWSMALGENGESLYVTSVRPNPGRYRDAPRSEVTIIETRRSVVVDRPPVAGANMMEGIAPVPGRNIVLFTLLRTKTLVPMTRVAQGWVITNGIGVIQPDGRIDQVLLDEPNAGFADPTDVAVSPDGRYALVSSGGSDRVAVLDVAKLLETIAGLSEEDRARVLPNHLGTSGRFIVKRIPVAHNPRGLVFSPDGRFAYVACALEDAVMVIDASDYTVAGRIDLGGPTEVTEIRWGERLFHSAGRTFGLQFSCRSCHPDGHINGLAFDIEADGIGFGPVDNRTLRGIVDTAPFKWEGTNPTLNFQCGPRLAVFMTRLAPFTPAELQALVRYQCTIERPPNPHRDPAGLTLAQRRGKAVFERAFDNRGRPMPAESRCITCHNTPYKTSRKQVAVGTMMWFDAPVDVQIGDRYDSADFRFFSASYFDDIGATQKAFDVPHLNNVCDSPPYLHNGSAGTLEQIWTQFNTAEGHGFTGDLTREQFNDLIAYLKAL